MPDVWLEEGETGRLETVFRRTDLPLDLFVRRFPDAPLTPDEARAREKGDDIRIAAIEATRKQDGKVRYTAFRQDPPEARSVTGGAGRDDAEKPLAAGTFADHPVIAFRWMKAPGEAWGRSPVMKALPDIRTANKVVELVLKNASIAVTGMWQADDDGVINPANIKLSPGVVIPKAVGSEGLKPLAAPGRFDVSELVLNDLRQRIRRALLVDKLGQIDSPKMTATEVLERKAEMARLLGATFGRLQSELLTPLVERGLGILRRRREVPPVRIDGRTIALAYASPLAQEQAHRDIGTVTGWADLVSRLGPAGMAAVDAGKAARWAGRILGVPSALITPEPQRRNRRRNKAELRPFLPIRIPVRRPALTPTTPCCNRSPPWDRPRPVPEERRDAGNGTPDRRRRFGDGDDLRDVARAAARCFGTDDGRKLLAHLRAITIERVCGPHMSEAALRDLEGQRRLVHRLYALIDRGRRGE